MHFYTVLITLYIYSKPYADFAEFKSIFKFTNIIDKRLNSALQGSSLISI